jgi:hypothetical protein
VTTSNLTTEVLSVAPLPPAVGSKVGPHYTVATQDGRVLAIFLGGEEGQPPDAEANARRFIVADKALNMLEELTGAAEAVREAWDHNLTEPMERLNSEAGDARALLDELAVKGRG